MKRDEKPDRLDYMSDLIFELERMAREEGLSKLAALLREAHEEADRHRKCKAD